MMRDRTSLIRRLAVVPLALLALSGVGCSRGGAAGGDEEAAPVVAPAELQAHVNVVAAVQGELPVFRRALGVVVAPRQAIARVSSRIAGVIASVDVVDGQEVAEGAVLAKLDAPAATEALARATASLASADADLRRATQGGLDGTQAELDLGAAQADLLARQTRQEASRQEALLAESFTSEKAATEARQAADAAERASRAAAEKSRVFRDTGRSAELARLQAAVDQVRAELHTAELDAGATIVRAPCGGRISKLDATVGRVVERGAALADVASSSATAVRVGLAPRDVNGVLLGAVVVVPRVDGASCTGHVTSIGGATDPDTGLIPIEALLDASPPPSTLPRIGESIRAEITSGPPARGILVPVAALSFVDDKATVVTVDENAITHATPVRVLARTTESAIVVGDGIREGTDVVIAGNFKLPDGAHVVPDRVK
ncbi:MAG: HlyD family efflux transporter periplasmic adaptor subunit [Planctomycetes bacterium]|nr:HlyD family efflux transporter periplasmic adaptor subunit [Planctomycetota bacterium]